MPTVTPFVLLPSATYTASQTSEARNNNGAGAHIIINVSDLNGGTPSITPAIEAWDPGSQAWYPLLTGLAIAATGTTVLKIGRGIAAVANAAAADGLPRRWRISVTHADAQGIDYSVGFNYLP